VTNLETAAHRMHQHPEYVFPGVEFKGNYREVFMDWFKHAIALVPGSVAAINSKSTSIKTREAPKKLNKKRALRGKPPIYSYHVVNIPSRDSTSSANGSADRVSPRLHWRRGHLRQIPKGLVAVSPSLVGCKDLGFIAKEYRYQ